MASQGSISPVANLFPGVMKDINAELTELKKDPDESIILGISMAVVGNIVTTLGLNLQRYAHSRGDDPRVPYTAKRLWWLGVFCMVLGEFGNFAAYGFAPATLVAPLGAVSVVANAAIATAMLSEEFRTRDVAGTFLVIFGGAGLVYTSPRSEVKLDTRTLLAYIFSDIFFIYCGVLVLLFVAVLSVSRRYSARFVVTDLTLCAILGSWTVLATKGLSVSLRMTMLNEENAFKSWVVYVLIGVMAVTASFQIRFLNRAMRNFGTSQVVPVYYVLFTLASVIGGIVLYREFAQLVAWRILSFFGAVVITFLGVHLITSDRSTPEDDEQRVYDEEDATFKEAARLEGSLVGGGFGLGVGLLLTPFCFPLFMCCAVFTGVGIGGVTSTFTKPHAEGGLSARGGVDGGRRGSGKFSNTAGRADGGGYGSVRGVF